MPRYLLGGDQDSAGEVTLRSDAHGLTVTQQNRQSRLRAETDYTCTGGGELKLVRKYEGHIKLPPLIDQTVATTYVFKRTPSGDLQVDVYAQTVAAPYGVRLRGPVQFEKSLIWALSKSFTHAPQAPTR